MATDSMDVELNQREVADARHLEAARLLIRMGRAWLKLTTVDVERGAAAVSRDPCYGSEIIHAARAHARELRDSAVLAAVTAAGDTVRDGWPMYQRGTEGAGAGASRERSDPSPSGPGSLAPHDTGGV